MTDDKRRELEASASLGETSLWIEALAEDATDEQEVMHLARILNTEIEAFLADSSQAVPLLIALQRREDGP